LDKELKNIGLKDRKLRIPQRSIKSYQSEPNYYISQADCHRISGKVSENTVAVVF
jgi:hypothetical protein